MKVELFTGVHVGKMYDKRVHLTKPANVIISAKPYLIMPGKSKAFPVFSDREGLQAEFGNLKGVKYTAPVATVQNSTLLNAELEALDLHKGWKDALGIRCVQLNITTELLYVLYDIRTYYSLDDKPFAYKVSSKFYHATRFKSDDQDRTLRVYINMFTDDKVNKKCLYSTRARGVSTPTAIKEGIIKPNWLGKSFKYTPTLSDVPFFSELAVVDSLYLPDQSSNLDVSRVTTGVDTSSYFDDVDLFM